MKNIMYVILKQVLLHGIIFSWYGCQTVPITRPVEHRPFFRLEAYTDLDTCNCVKRTHNPHNAIKSEEIMDSCMKKKVKIFDDLNDCQDSIRIMEDSEQDQFTDVTILTYTCNEIFLKDQKCGEAISHVDSQKENQEQTALLEESEVLELSH